MEQLGSPQKGPRFKCSVCMCVRCLHIPLMSAWVYTGYFGSHHSPKTWREESLGECESERCLFDEVMTCPFGSFSGNSLITFTF